MADDRDHSIFQPTQAIAGALGSTIGGTAAMALASKFADKPAARFGRRMGAFVRLAGKMAQSKSSQYNPAGAVASGLGRQQGRLVSMLGRHAMRANIAGGALAAGSAVGDVTGDWAARRATGAQGKDDDFRHQSMLGMAGAAVGGLTGHMVAGARRKMRWARPLTRKAAGFVGAVAGTVAGEALGNVHDERIGATAALIGDNRRLGKAAGPTEVSEGNYEDAQRGYGTAFQQSWLPSTGKTAAQRFTATDSATGGSTLATGNSAGFGAWQKQKKQADASAAWSSFMGRFNVGSASSSSFFSGATGGSPYDSLGKRDTGGQLSEAEHAQRVAAAKASAEKRKKGGVGGPKLATNRRLYGQVRIDPNDPDFDGKGDTQDAAEPSGLYRHRELRPQRPKDMPEAEYLKLAAHVGKTMRGERDRIITDAQNKGLISGHGKRGNQPKTDPAVVKMAYHHAGLLAQHDLGLHDMRFRMNPEAMKQLDGMHEFLWHARRAQANKLRQDMPGAFAPFRREFGKAFKDGRTYQFDTQGQAKGETKKRFYRHLSLIKQAV